MLLLTFILFLTGFFVAFHGLKGWIRRKKILSLLPGPKQFLCFGNLRDANFDDATLFRTLRKWSKEYYPVYYLSSVLWDAANISGPEDFKRVASTIKNIQKGPMYSFFNLWLGDGVLQSIGSKWQSRRKLVTEALHFNVLRQFVSIFNNETNNLVEVLKKECHKPHINVVPHITLSSLLVISETAMGIKLKMENEEDKSYIDAIHHIGKLIYRRVLRPWLYFNPIYYHLSSSGCKEKKLVHILDHLADTVIKERSKNFKKFEADDNEEYNRFGRKSVPFVDSLLNEKLSGNLIDDKGIKDEISTLMFGGHDTSSMSLCFTLMLLACHKDMQEMILEEINQVIGDIKSQPTYDDLQKLNFMERFIKASLRLYPIAPFISRILEEDVVTSKGHTLPKDTIVNIHIFDIHRDPRMWPDPEKFDPDRFLPENCKDRHPFSYVPFSAGPRNCPGQKFAILEIKAMLCGILRNFILEPVDFPESIVLVPNIVLTTENDTIRVKFIPRCEGP